MKLGIDLHNIRDGGGVNYIANLIGSFVPEKHGFDTVLLVGASETLDAIPDKQGVEKLSFPELSRSLPYRLKFLVTRLTRVIRENRCDMLYSPGGMYFGSFRPFASISRNMMPYSLQEWRSYGFGVDLVRLMLLRQANSKTFKRADAMIFLTEQARVVISAAAHFEPEANVRVIPHGVNHELFGPKVSTKRQCPDKNRPIRLVYPSRFEPYKHQAEVVKAIALLRERFPELNVEFFGPANRRYLTKFRQTVAQIDPCGRFTRYNGAVPSAKLAEIYAQSDMLLFVSSCENLPNTMIEAMAAGIPVVAANVEPIPSLGKDGCLYVDPTDPRAIAEGIASALINWESTLRRADLARQIAAKHSWTQCANETFSFLAAATKNFRRAAPR
jgi:glycosyltransferase involved in cell wall biosynthesis